MGSQFVWDRFARVLRERQRSLPQSWAIFSGLVSFDAAEASSSHVFLRCLEPCLSIVTLRNRGKESIEPHMCELEAPRSVTTSLHRSQLRALENLRSR